jgi:hypothetical protein
MVHLNVDGPGRVAPGLVSFRTVFAREQDQTVTAPVAPGWLPA